MIRFAFTLFCSFLFTAMAFAIPAKRTTLVELQPDGTTLSLRLCGDEAYHYYTTLDNVPVVQRADGGYYYAVWEAGSLAASVHLAHDADGRSADEQTFLNQSGDGVLQSVRAHHKSQAVRRNEQRARRAARQSSATRGEGGNSSVIGERKGLIILVNFTDTKFKITAPQPTFHAMANEVGYNGNGQFGSVHDYFLSQSEGQLSLTFDVVGPVQLSHNMAYYGADSGGEGNDVRPGAMVAEACTLVNAQVDFSDYDWNGDGEVEQVYLIYAGYGQAGGATASTIWPHEWQLRYSDYGKTLVLDGTTIDTYACSSELAGRTGTNIDGIGTTCHEFSHCLGLPDLYDTQGSSFGMDVWSVMDYGCYNDNGRCPMGYTAYEKAFCGWLRPKELNTASKVNDLAPVCEGGEAYVIYNEGNKDEYYLLENIQQTGWYTYAPGHGLMVTHVDYDENAWYENTVNATTSHQRLTLIPADGRLLSTVASLAGDLYPGTSGNTALTDTSSPAAKVFNLNADGRRFMGKPIERIAESAEGLISFDFMGGIPIESPQALPATHVNAAGFTANWKPVDGATSYTLQLTTYAGNASTPATVLAESFASFVTSGTGNNDLSAKLDQFTTMPGWEGYKLFNSPLGVKVGSSSTDGYLLTPSLHGTEGGDVTVTLRTLSYNTIAPLITVSLLDEAGRTLQTESFHAPTDEPSVEQITFAKAPSAFRIRIDSQKRAYLSEVQVTAATSSTVTELAGLTGITHTFTGLTGTRFSYVVKAVTPDGVSPWSNVIEVDLPTDISHATADSFATHEEVEVYTLTGKLLRRARFAQWSGGLAPGIYLLRGESAVRKIQIK